MADWKTITKKASDLDEALAEVDADELSDAEREQLTRLRAELTGVLAASSSRA
jgi:hypothetical protein